jgi:hypothetical protein
MIGDNWPQYMWAHMLATGDFAAVFFIFIQIFGKYILLNLFLAILLENFEEMDEEQENQDKNQANESET